MDTTTEITTLKRLYELGQSPWYDNIDRRFLASGGLKGLIDNGIMGLTSNPTIFQKAVDASDIYNSQIQGLAGEGKAAKEIYDEITVSDVRTAADLLRGVYQRTKGADGYVSIEVYPEYAHDPENTIRYARMIYERIKRDNIMIKVPGTKEGYGAIRSLIRDGINVNVTLLFSVAHYERAASAYIEGLGDRLDDGKEIGTIASVASVFVSRVDTKIDKMLTGTEEEALKGQAAVSNVKMIYQKFKEVFGDNNFGRLRKKGGRAQRPLWASTSTKDPAYSDVKYVETLVGRDTVNTLPHQTVEAFLDHGKPELNIEKGLDSAKMALERLKTVKIEISEICQIIQDDGVSAFQASFDKLIETIKNEIGKSAPSGFSKGIGRGDLAE